MSVPSAEARTDPGRRAPARRATSLLWVLLLSTRAPGAAQGLDPAKAFSQYGIDSWTTENGLPHATVMSLLQTRDGYVWLATLDGLARFDGVRFTVYNTNNTPGLGNNGVMALCEDGDGALWIATNGGGLSRLANGSFTRYTLSDGLPSDIVWAVHPARDGGVWIGTNGGGLARFKDGRFQRERADETGRVIASIAEDREGALWVVSQGEGLARRPPGGRWTRPSGREGLPAGVSTIVAEDRSGRVWVGTDLGGLARWEAGRLVASPPSAALGAVTTIREDSAGTIWIGTNGRGLGRLRVGEEPELTVFGTADGLPETAVFALLADREGALWIGTNGGGLARVRDGVFTPYAAREGLSRDFVYAACVNPEGGLWIGTTAGLDLLREGRVTHVTLEQGERPHAVRSLARDRGGDLWVGTWGAGVFRGHGSRWRRYTTRDGLAVDRVRAVLADREGRVWVATVGGLSVFENGSWRTYRLEQGLPRNSLIGVLQDRAGSIWVGSDGGGLAVLEDGRFRTFTTQEGLASDVVLCLYEDSDGVLWVGTNGGLSRLRDGRFDKFTAAAGLPSNGVTQVVDDGKGHLWIGTNKGICKVSKAALDQYARGSIARLPATVFDRSDGMKSSECTAPGQPAAIRSEDGRLWFATTRGIVVVDPAVERPREAPTSVLVEEVRLDGRRAPPAAPVVVPPGTERLQIRYTALGVLDPGRVRFRFRLEGFDRSWVDAGDRRSADYTGVPPGDYVFRVTALETEGTGSGPGGSLLLRVEPRLYQTRVFAALAALLLAGLVAGGYRLRVSSMKARERELTALVGDRTRTLAREKERAERAREEAERLLDAARALALAADVPTVLAGVLKELRRVVPCDSAAIHEIRGWELTIVGVHGFPHPESVLGLRLDIASGGFPNLADVVHTRAPVILDDAWATYSGFRSEPHAQAAIRSWMGLPLLFGDRLIGLLTLDKKEVGFYTAEHARLAQAFAAQAAVAMENARLYAAAQNELAERERAQGELQRSEARYRELVESATDLIYRTDLSGRFTYVNSEGRKLLRFSEEELATKTSLELVRPDWRERVAAFYRKQQAERTENTYFELPVVTGEGKDLWLGCSVQLLLENGGPVAFHAINRDISDRKLLEQWHEDLTHTMVHDLRSPLTSIISSLELLGAGRSEQERQVIEIAEANSRRLLGLVNAILDVSQLETGAMSLEREPVALSALAAEVVELQRPVAERKDLRLTSDVAADVPAAFADRALLSRVLQNLVGNAVKFTPPGGFVRVRAEVEGDELVTKVSDSGPGVPDDVRERLFQKFVSGRQRGRGSGLGLALCRLAVEAHGGRIWLEGGKEGSTFSFTLPLAR